MVPSWQIQGGVAILALVLVAVIGGCGQDEILLDQIELEGAAEVPEFVVVLGDDGAAASEWVGRRWGTIGWIEEPELLLFTIETLGGAEIVAGDPADGVVYRVARLGNGWYETAEARDELILTDGTESRRVRLPGRLASNEDGQESGSAGGIQAGEGGIVQENRLLLPHRGLEQSVLPSPSGRWFAVTERQPRNTWAIYSIGTDGRDARFEGPARQPEPGDWPEGSYLSPDRRWVMSGGSVQTVLRHADGRTILLPAGSDQVPHWRDDGAALVAMFFQLGAAVAELPEGRLQVLLPGAAPAAIGWQGERVRWLAHTLGDDE